MASNSDNCERIVNIDLDNTDTDCMDSESDVVIEDLTQTTDYLNETLDYFVIDINNIDTELDLQLIEEIIAEDTQQSTIEIIDNNNHNRTEDNKHIEDIKNYLMSDSNQLMSFRTVSEDHKSEIKEKNELLIKLMDENKVLNCIVSELRRELKFKKNENKELEERKRRLTAIDFNSSIGYKQLSDSCDCRCCPHWTRYPMNGSENKPNNQFVGRSVIPKKKPFIKKSSNSKRKR